MLAPKCALKWPLNSEIASDFVLESNLNREIYIEMSRKRLNGKRRKISTRAF